MNDCVSLHTKVSLQELLYAYKSADRRKNERRICDRTSLHLSV
jgi:hypothetical protein